VPGTALPKTAAFAAVALLICVTLLPPVPRADGVVAV
jgi:hypothetical protein